MAVAEFVAGSVGIYPQVGECRFAKGTEESGEGVDFDTVEPGCDIGGEVGLSEDGGRG